MPPNASFESKFTPTDDIPQIYTVLDETFEGDLPSPSLHSSHFTIPSSPPSLPNNLLHTQCDRRPYRFPNLNFHFFVLLISSILQVICIKSLLSTKGVHESKHAACALILIISHIYALLYLLRFVAVNIIPAICYVYVEVKRCRASSTSTIITRQPTVKPVADSTIDVPQERAEQTGNEQGLSIILCRSYTNSSAASSIPGIYVGGNAENEGCTQLAGLDDKIAMNLQTFKVHGTIRQPNDSTALTSVQSLDSTNISSNNNNKSLYTDEYEEKTSSEPTIHKKLRRNSNLSDRTDNGESKFTALFKRLKPPLFFISLISISSVCSFSVQITNLLILSDNLAGQWQATKAGFALFGFIIATPLFGIPYTETHMFCGIICCVALFFLFVVTPIYSLSILLRILALLLPSLIIAIDETFDKIDLSISVKTRVGIEGYIVSSGALIYYKYAQYHLSPLDILVWDQLRTFLFFLILVLSSLLLVYEYIRLARVLTVYEKAVLEVTRIFVLYVYDGILMELTSYKVEGSYTTITAHVLSLIGGLLVVIAALRASNLLIVSDVFRCFRRGSRRGSNPSMGNEMEDSSFVRHGCRGWLGDTSSVSIRSESLKTVAAAKHLPVNFDCLLEELDAQERVISLLHLEQESDNRDSLN